MRHQIFHWFAALAIVLQIASLPLHVAMAGPNGHPGTLAALSLAIGEDVAFCDHDAGGSSTTSAPAHDHRSQPDDCAICQFVGHGGAIAAPDFLIPPGPVFAVATIAPVRRDDPVGKLVFLAAQPRAPPALA